MLFASVPCKQGSSGGATWATDLTTSIKDDPTCASTQTGKFVSVFKLCLISACADPSDSAPIALRSSLLACSALWRSHTAFCSRRAFSSCRTDWSSSLSCTIVPENFTASASRSDCRSIISICDLILSTINRISPHSFARSSRCARTFPHAIPRMIVAIVFILAGSLFKYCPMSLHSFTSRFSSSFVGNLPQNRPVIVVGPVRLEMEFSAPWLSLRRFIELFAVRRNFDGSDVPESPYVPFCVPLFVPTPLPDTSDTV